EREARRERPFFTNPLQFVEKRSLHCASLCSASVGTTDKAQDRFSLLVIHLSNVMSADEALPFQLDALGVRGRLVRLGPALDAIIERHGYPLAVARPL